MTDDPFDSIAPEGDQGAVPPSVEGSDDAPHAAAAAFPLNDFGNAQRFQHYCGKDLMHVPRVGWFVWTGQRWRHDVDTVAVRREAQTIAGHILDETKHLWRYQSPADRALEREAVEAAEALARLQAQGPLEPGSPSSIEAKRLGKKIEGAAPARDRLSSARREHKSHGRSSGNKSRIDAILVESVTMMSHDLDALDADPILINCESGVLRFSVSEPGDGAGRVATVELNPHIREDLVTKMMPVAYDPAATAPRFMEFLKRVQPDPLMQGFIQRWLGLSMTALLHQQLCFWFGGGANGKSVLIDIIARILGDYAATAKIQSLTGRNRRAGGDATPDLVPLIGARMVRASEPEEGERLQEGKIKELTGGEPILVRALHEDFVEVQPRFKLTISGNHKPEIRGDDDGIWRRMLLVPWEVTIPEAERDPLLSEKLWEERDGIFQWLVEGLLAFLEGGLAPPDVVSAATTEYRREQDPVGMFLADAAIFTGDPSDVIYADDLSKRFAYWLLETGMGAWKPATIAKRLSAKAGSWRHPKSGQVMTKGKNSRINYVGVRMVDAFETRFGNAPKDQGGNPLGVAQGVTP